jgi:hypothetical protein
MMLLTVKNAIFYQKYQMGRSKAQGSTGVRLSPRRELGPKALAESSPWFLDSVYLGRYPEPAEGR